VSGTGLQPFYFGHEEQGIFGMLHEPVGTPNGRGFVLCYPFAEERLWVHRVYVNLSALLAGMGYAVLRFDFTGHGDSDGDFEDATVETRLEDIRQATLALREKAELPRGVGLLGLRFGATLAALAADRDPDCRMLALWEPILDGSAYMQELLRSNLATQTAVYKEIRYNRQMLVEIMHSGRPVNVDGYGLSADMYDQACGIDLAGGRRGFAGPTLVVQVDRQEAPPREQLRGLCETYRDAELRAAVEQPFWKEIRPYYPRADNLFQVTREWLESGEKP